MKSISHIDHIAIAVVSIESVRDFYEKSLGLKIDHIEEMPERGIRTAFIKVGQTMIELIEPLQDRSEISAFLERRGPGLHHLAFATSDIAGLEKSLANQEVKLIYPEARPGAHQSKVNFIHPKATGGVLMELVEKEGQS